MDAQTKILLTNYIDECEKDGLFFVCQKHKTETGAEYLVQRLYELMNLYKNWTPSQCLSQIEVELSEQNYY